MSDTFLCIYSTAITPLDSSLKLLQTLMTKFGERIEARKIISRFFTDKSGEFFSVTHKTGKVDMEFLFWVLSSDGYNINQISEFSLPDFKGAIYIVIAPETLPNSFESLYENYLSRIREEFQRIYRFFDGIGKMMQDKWLILYLHHQETFISLENALGSDLYSMSSKRAIYIDCPIEDLDRIRLLITEYIQN